MKKIWQIVLFLVGVFTGLMIVARADSLNYTVIAQLPENQITHKVSYFDLLVKKGQRQKLTIVIKNNDQKAHKYIVSANRAITNDNGVIDYSYANAKADTSLKFNLNKAISGKQAIKIPAKTSKKVSFQLSIPKNGFPGIALGGISVVQVLDKTQQESGMSIRNQYAYVIGLKLQEKNRATVKPDLKLVNVKAKQIDYQNYVTARLQNPRPEIIHGLKIRSYITAANSNKKVYITNKKDMAMAPNSSFNFAIGNGERALVPGKYVLHLTATSSNGKYKWRFIRNFTISKQTAQALNDTAINHVNGNGYFWWLIIGLGMVIIVLLLLIIWLLKKNKTQVKQ